jgi:hypothetical protein
MPTIWYISMPPLDAAAAPKCFSLFGLGGPSSPVRTGHAVLHLLADPVAHEAPFEHRLDLIFDLDEVGAAATLPGCDTPNRGSFPTSDAADALWAPSTLERAPITELM